MFGKMLRLREIPCDIKSAAGSRIMPSAVAFPEGKEAGAKMSGACHDLKKSFDIAQLIWS